MANRIITMVAILTLSTSPLSLLKAEDYPQEYLGSGYREYLGGRIQNGYYVEVFTKMDMRQKERVNKRNQVEEILKFSSQATPQSSQEILALQSEEKENSDNLKTEIAKERQEREEVATAQAEFRYIKYSNGKIVYFKDSLASSIYNERVVDEFGNINIKDTRHMRYNDRRLLTGYEADLRDNLGNITHQRWYGATYTDDSVFYADEDTNANKNLSEYYLEETDSAGNVKLTHWQGLSYEGKFLRAFSQTTEDSIYGIATFTRSNITYENNDPKHASSYHEEGIGTDNLAYSLERSDITYNDKDQATAYHEVMFATQIDGTKTKTTTDAQLKYLDVSNSFGPDVEEEPEPNRLLETIITAITENANGSTRTETTTTGYDYDEQNQLIGASGHSEFSGQEADWYEYTDAAGYILARNQDEYGNVTYSYIDPETLETVIVPAHQVSATLKEGNKYTGSSSTQYESLYGKSMTKQVDSRISNYGRNISENELISIEDSTIIYTNGLVNNLQRVLGSQEHTKATNPLLDPDHSHIQIRDVTTTYLHDEKGNLMDAQGQGTGKGWEYQPTRGWFGEYTSAIREDYAVILGKPLKELEYIDKDYKP